MIEIDKSILKHCIKRIAILIFCLIISIPIGLSMLDPDRMCGTGDVYVIMIWMFVFYILWALYLLIESFFKHKKDEISKRNSNIIMALFLPIIFILFWFYFNFMEWIN
jgi:hypothetical protein